MRCLRQITSEQLTATVFLSKGNFDILEKELNQNFNMLINDMSNSVAKERQFYKVRVVPPARSITLKQIRREYSLFEKVYESPVNFELKGVVVSRYASLMYEKKSISHDISVKETNIDDLKERFRYSKYSLVGEIARFLNISCVLAAKIIRESVDGEDAILEAVNKYYEILDDVIVPRIFHTLYEVKSIIRTEDRELILLKEPKDGGYYEFSGRPELVVTNKSQQFSSNELDKTFHSDTYVFDSKPELECFIQYVTSNKVRKVYFTGMFTSNQGDLSIQYFDPTSRRIRMYYPDFFAEMTDGTYQIIEVKGDNMIDDEVVKAKADAASVIATYSGVEYKMYIGSELMKTNVL